MKYLKFIGLGVVFGIMFTKAEVISWYRIQEMFRFESFHMYGVIGSAVVLGAIGTAIIKHWRMKDLYGKKQRPAAWAPGRRNGMANNNFKKLLKKYISIKGLDIVVYLEDGKIIELNKNRALVKNEIVIRDKNDREYRIQLSAIRSVELYAA